MSSWIFELISTTSSKSSSITSPIVSMTTDHQLDSSALRLLSYIHPLIVGLFYLVALRYSLYTFQRATSLGIMRRRITLLFMLILSFSYLAEAVYYAYLGLISGNQAAPRHAVIYVVGATMVWTPFTTALFMTSSSLWPYFGTFMIDCLLHVAHCLTISLLPTQEYLITLRLGMSVARTIVSFGLLCATLLPGQTENFTDEEVAPLLGNTHEQGQIHGRTSWIVYVKRYAVFLPYLWPKEDPVLPVWFAVRIVIVILGRIFTFAIARQEGTLTDVILSKRLPRKDLAWWITLHYLDVGSKRHEFGIHIVSIVLTLVIAYFWLGVLLTTWVNPIRRIWTEASRTRSQISVKSISLHSTITYFNRVEFERDRYEKAVAVTMAAFLHYVPRLYTGQAIQGVLVLIGYCLATTVVLWRIASGHNSIGAFVTFLRYWNSITRLLKTITRSYQSITSMLVDAGRLLQLLGLTSAVVDPEPARELDIISSEVRFQDVDFAYDIRKPLLRGVSFNAKPGAKIALVSKTGSGKSSILNLLFRCYNVNEGSITIDGQDVRSVTLRSLREAFGIVQQKGVTNPT
ncbi:hypothetical protein K505DRAFT_400526 [Melanomma pulvis-pyrius CBS 109.77]|uniref:ABC transmembrane type-1 domain-containing protein n=1 Tax=Melanomma pulvis-pyrius CBS 109.77 TaxID=1314802 RepID=A0A6A6WPR2_9PLEO|nr:hypothetical protein K505DRAFT_400526 [Melanomma pulvis-pyrius CBS 109.77]